MSVAPKRPKGPPLNAMRAFEAAARHESFVTAAEELNVTAGAISQHIKSLETWAETPLFHRNAHGVELTQSGRALVGDFIAAFDGLAAATRALRNLSPNSDFRIATLPAIAQLWLPKRLARIRAAFPDINFSVTAMEAPPALSRELFDLAIFFGRPDERSGRICLRQDEIIPVCAPSLMEHFGTHGYRGMTLLHDQTWSNDWEQWSEAAGISLADTQAGPSFSLYSLAVEEAKAGAGALMGHACLIEDFITSGNLVRLSDTAVETGKALILKVPKEPQQRAETSQVAELLLQ